MHNTTPEYWHLLALLATTQFFLALVTPCLAVKSVPDHEFGGLSRTRFSATPTVLLGWPVPEGSFARSRMSPLRYLTIVEMMRASYIGKFKSWIGDVIINTPQAFNYLIGNITTTNSSNRQNNSTFCLFTCSLMVPTGCVCHCAILPNREAPSPRVMQQRQGRLSLVRIIFLSNDKPVLFEI